MKGCTWCHWYPICPRLLDGQTPGWAIPSRELTKEDLRTHDPSWGNATEEKKNHPFMTKQWLGGWTCFKSYADSTECIYRELIALLLEAMGFAYSEDNAYLSSPHVKDIAHHSPVKLVLLHQESRCICYQYFSQDWRKNNHLVMTQQRLIGWTDFYK